MNATEIIARRRAMFENPDAIDSAALACVESRYVIRGDFLQQILGTISGANFQAANTGQYYQNALNQVGPGGTAAAKAEAALESKALQPQFTAQDNQLAARESAMGIGHSGAAKADFSDLTSQQGATLAGNEAPLYGQALGIYGNILGQEPGAQNSAYGNALSEFYQQLDTAAAAAGGVPAGVGAPSVSNPGSAALNSSGYQSPAPGSYGWQGNPSDTGAPSYGDPGYQYGDQQ